MLAGLIGSSSPRWLKADLVVCANPSSASRVWVDDCFFWYRLTRVVPSKGPLNGSVMCACVYLSLSLLFVIECVYCWRVVLHWSLQHVPIKQSLWTWGRQFLSRIFVSISQVIGCEDRLRNDLYCVEWGVKLYSNQLLSRMHSRKLGIWPKIKRLLLLEHVVHL